MTDRYVAAARRKVEDPTYGLSLDEMDGICRALLDCDASMRTYRDALDRIVALLTVPSLAGPLTTEQRIATLLDRDARLNKAMALMGGLRLSEFDTAKLPEPVQEWIGEQFDWLAKQLAANQKRTFP